jgi:hypothetical protein
MSGQRKAGRFFKIFFMSILLVFFWRGLSSDGAQQKATTQARPAKIPTASVKIVYFNKATDPTRMAARIGESSGPPRIYANYGETVRLSWTVEACHAGTITGSISHHGPVDLGEKVDIGNKCVRMRNTTEITVTSGGTYTLRVSAVPLGPASVKEKSVEVILRNYNVEISDVDFNTATRELAIYGRNRGEVDIAANELQIHYVVRGIVRGPGPVIQEDWINRRSVAIPRGQRVELGHYTLPESVYSYQGLSVKTRIFGESFGFGTKEQTFSVPLNPREISFNEVILDAFITTMVGDVRFNNYDPALRTAEEISVAPYKRNDSWVEIMGDRTTFSPEVIRLHFSITGSWSGREYVGVSFRGFINNISLAAGRPRTVLKPGLVGVRLVFDTSVSREIKGFILNDGIYNDEMGPDIEINRLEVEILIRPCLNGQKISFCQVSSEIDVSTTFAGGWHILDRFAPTISNGVEDTVRQIVRQQIGDMLNTNANKRLLEDFFDGLLRAAGVNNIRTMTVNERGITLSVY